MTCEWELCNMTKGKVLWWVAIVLGAVIPVWAEEGSSAQDEGVAVGVTGDVFSKYIWRGQNIVDNWVFQPGVSVGYQGLTGSIWNNMNMRDEPVGGAPVEAGNLTETDFTLDYSHQVPGVESLGFSVGAIYYAFLNIHAHPTAEAYGGLNLNIPSTPTLRWYYDFDEADGSYVQFSVGHTIEKLREWRKNCYCGLQVGASLGMGTANYDRFYFGVDETALNDFTLTASLPICFGKLTIKPSLGYSTMLNKDIRAATENSDNFWGGVGLAYSF
jgi:hypothetical protein